MQVPVAPGPRAHSHHFGKLPLEIGLVLDANHLADDGHRQIGIDQQEAPGFPDPEPLAPAQHGLAPAEPHVEVQLTRRHADVGGDVFDARKGLDIALVIHPGRYGLADARNLPQLIHRKAGTQKDLSLHFLYKLN